MKHLFELTKELIIIPSVTGNEAAVADFVGNHLQTRGFQIREQNVGQDRKNILATLHSTAKVILCTHMDTVPPFIAADEDEHTIYGRGACDAKGILAAMIVAASTLKDMGMTEFGLLFVVGEETDSLGAKTANSLAIDSEYIIVGEPTENKLGIGHKGLTTLRLEATGRSAHSAFPALGDSAIDKLLKVLNSIRRIKFGEDAILGKSLVNIGTIEGGVAHNVIPEKATATISIRNTVPSTKVIETLRARLNGDIDMHILSRSEPQKLFTLPNYEQVVLPFGTDIPHLKHFGKPLLIGPGSAKVAHTSEECVSKKQLAEAVEIYINLVQKILTI